MSALGRKTPHDWSHVERYPLSALPDAELPKGVPVAIGVNWYSNFDHPVRGRDGRWRVGDGDLGYVRGGHCVCLRPFNVYDHWSWWTFYDQGSEGACVGFGSSRMMTLLNRERYNPWWLWDMAKIQDEWPETNPGDADGTSVHAAMTILRTKGAVEWKAWMSWPGWWQARDEYPSQEMDGISAVRWATNVDEIVHVLGYPDTVTRVPLLNSWGRDYPHAVWVPLEVLARLIAEEGEAALVTDR